MHPKDFPLKYWKLAEMCLGNVEETHTKGVEAGVNKTPFRGPQEGRLLKSCGRFIDY